MRAIISVSDKSGIEEFAGDLAALGVEIFSTGGTKKALSAAGVPVHSVSELTGFPEILDGRVKTLHPAVHGGILARRSNPKHLEQLAEHGLGTIDMVVVNLYPFARTVANPDVTLSDALENIDIGGPTMIRSAAKNHPDVIVLVDPADYPVVLQELKAGGVSECTRKRLAAVAFQHTASYDTLIAEYLRDGEEFPSTMTLALEKVQKLRYGENPHQTAAFYRTVNAGPPDRNWSLGTAKQLHGKELSYNNILDADGAY
ncbi:MAG: bifunctional phosphoribosylaminoimidazolecarboxamide formyltransferase/IMP cyclohydrolase, partial [Chloroflexi bacterium]|nr:bifunctional phosphoribosylaminoimidazolecarboxamide formyltransferase/IMP cyclohydrolase [Chloroflexota bacterium]